LSVFRAFAEFQKINPVVKAYALVCDDGEVLMDPTLILQYGELEAGLGRRQIAPVQPALRRADVTMGVAWHFTQQMIAEVVPQLSPLGGLLYCSRSPACVPIGSAW
jgi:glutathione S-transferase